MTNATFGSALVAAMLLVAAVAKLSDHGAMRSFLISLGFPRSLANASAMSAAPIELIVGLCLLVTPTRTLALPAALALAITFVGLHGRALATGSPTCRCFGAFDVEEARVSLLRAVFLLGAVGATILATLSRDPASSAAGSDSASLMLGLATGISVTLAFLLVGQIVRFGRHRPRFTHGAVVVGEEEVRA